MLATKQQLLFYNMVHKKYILFTAWGFELNTQYLGREEM